jgi:hypothetical protein
MKKLLKRFGWRNGIDTFIFGGELREEGEVRARIGCRKQTRVTKADRSLQVMWGKC